MTARKQSAAALHGRARALPKIEIDGQEEKERVPGAAPGYLRKTLSHIYGQDRERSASGSDLSDACEILDDRLVNIDEGIAINDYKPSHLLQKKMSLIKSIKESRLRYLHELYAVHQYQHVLLRMETDYKHEMIILRELDPYFNFQDKIKCTLTDIGTGKEQRQKIFEQKIR